jgi:hypothetical protein
VSHHLWQRCHYKLVLFQLDGQHRVLVIEPYEVIVSVQCTEVYRLSQKLPGYYFTMGIHCPGCILETMLICKLMLICKCTSNNFENRDILPQAMNQIKPRIMSQVPICLYNQPQPCWHICINYLLKI